MLCTGTLERLEGSNNAHQVLSLAPFHLETCIIPVFVYKKLQSFIFLHFEVSKHQFLNHRTCTWILQRNENIFLCLIFIRLEVTRCFDSYLTSHLSTKQLESWRFSEAWKLFRSRCLFNSAPRLTSYYSFCFFFEENKATRSVQKFDQIFVKIPQQ